MDSDILFARHLLSNGRIKDAISKIESIVDNLENNSYYKNRLILVASQFNLSDKEKKLSLSNDNTRINKSILNLLEILHDLEVESDIVGKNENDTSYNLKDEKNQEEVIEPNVKDYRRLRIIYESNELFLEYFRGINKQLKRVILSDALDKDTLEEFTKSLESKLEELVTLKELIMDLEKQVRRKRKKLFIENDIFSENKHIYGDAEKLLLFSKEEMSLLEINYAINEIRKTLFKLQNPIREIDSQRIGNFLILSFFLCIISVFIYLMYKVISTTSPF